MNGIELWSRNLGMEGKGKDRKSEEKIFEVAAGGGRENARVFGQGRVTEGETEDKSRQEGMEMEEEAEGKKREKASEKVYGGDEGEM